MNKNNTVTIYLVNYNYGKYIEQAIESVLNQTYQDYELLIIDDGSTDNSHDVIKKHENNPNIYTVFQQNKGLIKTNNVALKLARGKYIVRLDADDYLEKNAIEKMVEALEKEGEDTVLVFPDYYNVDEHGDVINHYKRFDFNSEDLLLEKPAHGAVTMIRTDFLKGVGGYDEEFNCQDGYNIWLKVLNKYQVKNIPEPLFYYRQHSNNLTKDQKNLYQTRAKMMRKYVESSDLQEKKTCAVIPVRGSAVDPRSIPTAEVGDKKIINWTIDSALAASQVDNVLITTPDAELIDYVKSYYGDKVLVHNRDLNYARINIDITETLKDCVNFLDDLKVPIDYLMTLYLEYPFRCSNYIDKAIDHMNIYQVDAVDGVVQDNSIFYHHTGQGLERLNEDSFLRLEREDVYRRSGGIHIIKKECLNSVKNIWDVKTGHILLDEYASFRVDNQFSLGVANYLAAKME